MKKSIALLFFLLITSNLIYSQILWDDFEQNRIGYYDFVHGGMTDRYENPDINSSVNNSPYAHNMLETPEKCGMYLLSLQMELLTMLVNM